LKYKKKLLLTAAAGGILSIVCLVSSMDSFRPIQVLNRPESGTGDREQKLQVELEGRKYPFSFSLLEMPMNEEEIQKRLAETVGLLEETFLKDNTDIQYIVSDVCMPSVFPGTQISIQWYLDSWDYVKPDGTVENACLEEPVPVWVQAVTELQGQTQIWEKEIRVCPPKIPDKAQKFQMLEYKINSAQEQSEIQKIELPRTVFGQSVTWYPEADLRWIWMLMLTVSTVCAVIIRHHKEEEHRRQQREQSMQMDYPEIVSRLSLYMGAGISTRKAWERIVESYEEKGTGNRKPREAYEEMRTALYEMRSGVAEGIAYERFGARCRLLPYLKLGTLLSQNLRKGTRNLAGLLQEESREALENRKALAKKMGEECESKLLFPMIMMLLTILVMVMYPAIISFQM